MIDAGAVKVDLTGLNPPRRCSLSPHAGRGNLGRSAVHESRGDEISGDHGGKTSAEPVDRGAAAVAGLGAEVLLDAQELIVLRGAIGARQRPRFDLPAIGGDGE